MIKNVLSDIGGVGVYGVVSVCLFFTVFLGTVLWALCRKKTFLETMSRLPLHDGTTRPNLKDHSHE